VRQAIRRRCLSKLASGSNMRRKVRCTICDSVTVRSSRRRCFALGSQDRRRFFGRIVNWSTKITAQNKISHTVKLLACDLVGTICTLFLGPVNRQENATSFVHLCDQCRRRRSQSDCHRKNLWMRFCLAGARQVAIEHGDGNDAAPWHLPTGAEHADAASLMAAADVAGRTTLPELSGRIRSSRH
jgi:hypothetical protein